jgi:nitroreductase
MLKELVKKNRSYRRFDEKHIISIETLEELVDLTRFAPSAANFQPLRYVLVSDMKINKEIFIHTRWGGYIEGGAAPKEGERPSAYIVVTVDIENNKWAPYDIGIAAQTILLAANEKGLGGCMIASCEKDELAKILNVPSGFVVDLVIALGKPIEKVVIDEIDPGGDIKYWRDENEVHHVPKRKLGDVIICK